MDKLRCDFCSSFEVKWCYPAESFDVPEFNFTSEGNWCACDLCSELIENNDREGLRTRSLMTYFGVEQGDRKEVHIFLTFLHDLFWKNRKGKRIPETNN